MASGYGGHAGTTPPLGAVRSGSLPDLVAKVRSGVLRIETHTCSGDGIGTGILLGPRRIATVEHVVDGAASIKIKRNGKLLATAWVIGSDKARDVALLATSTAVTGYRFQFADKAPRVAEQVEVLGYPLGESLSAIPGSVSGLDRTIFIDGVRRRGLIQTDAAINFGNSGGPMMRVDNGKVMGLIDAVHAGDAHGISWAVSAQVAAPLLRDWNSSPQQVDLASCDAQLAEEAYARRIASILELSAAGRGNVGRIVSQVKVGTIVLSEGARQMKDPIANRQAVLRQIKTLPTAPAGAVDVAPALVAAIQTSLDADMALRTWMTNLPSDPAFKADHQQWKNSDFQLAEKLSDAATRAKAAFVALYNPLAQQAGLATWSAGQV